MRILLHIGTHKTGTTSIQKFCARNRPRLRKAGLWYPDYDLIGTEGHYAHHHLAHAIAGLETSRGLSADASRYFSEVRRQAGGGETILISAEPFWRHVHPAVELCDNEYPSGLAERAYWQGRRDYVARVRDAVGGDDAEIVVVLRRQDRCAESMFKERIKGIGYSDTFAAYLDAFSHRFRYFDQLSVWSEIFAKLHVLVYDDLIAQDDFVRAFFRALGVGIAGGLGPAPKSNISLNNDLIEYKRLVNDGLLSAEQLFRVAEAMAADGFEDGLALDRGSTFWISGDRRKAFLDSFEDQNAKVRRHFTALDRTTLFPAVAGSRKPAYAGLSPQTFRAIAARLAERLPE